MKFFYKSAIVLILLYPLFSMPALADEKGSEFYNFIQSQFKNLPKATLGSNSSSSDSNFVIKIGTVYDVEPGSMVDVPVNLYSPPWKMWGIELRIKYNPSVLSLNDVIEGDDFFDRNSGCGWEYFAWRHGPADHCAGVACPTGTIRVLGIADIGIPWGPPNCFNPGSPAHFISFRFLATNDYNERCNLFPLEFIWYECGDNAIWYSSPEDSTGFEQLTAYGSQVYSDDSLIIMSDSFPSYGGIPESCFEHPQFDSFRDRIIFHNGGIFIECDSTPVLIGDVNANSLPYEVADALLFSNYFIYGESIFTIALEDQIAATDINKDGETLKLEDLVQLIRIIVGFQDPDSTTDIEIDDGLFVLNDRDEKTILAYSQFAEHLIWFLFDGEISPESLEEDIVVNHYYDGQFTRVLVGDLGLSDSAFLPIFDYSGSGNLIEVQAANFEGHELKSNFMNCGLGVPCFSNYEGDINNNGISCEIADIILFGNYFLYGTSVFTSDLDQQISNSDVNLDGIVLGIADLVMLIRGIAGETASCPFDFDSTSPNTAIFRQDVQTQTIEMISPDTMGAALLVFDGDITATLLQQHVTFGSVFDSGQTRVLIWGFAGYSDTMFFAQGPLISYTGSGQLVEVRTATRRGDKVNTVLDISTDIFDNPDNLPKDFALRQNYPNPFNNETVIEFDLPRASEVKFEIINILGQVVYDVSSRYSAGSHTIYWDGSSNLGQTVGSGVYYYRITTGDFVSSKKMILLK